MKRATLTEEIRYDMSQFYPLKAVLEELFGKYTYNRLEETARLGDWKAETERLLKSIDIAITATVRIADKTWLDEIHNIIELGRKEVAASQSVTTLFSYLSATLTRLVFTQVGFFPIHYRRQGVPLLPRNWKLDVVRTVQYVQSAEQRETAERLRKRRKASRAALDTKGHGATPYSV